MKFLKFPFLYRFLISRFFSFCYIFSETNERIQTIDSSSSEEETEAQPPNLNRSDTINFYHQQSYESCEDSDNKKRRTLSCTSEEEPDVKKQKLRR